MNNKPAADAADTKGPPANRKQTMKTLTKLAPAAVTVTTAFSAQADWLSGYTRRDGTYVMPYYRTPANGIPYDNLSFRGYPSQQPGYISPRAWSSDSDVSCPKTMPSYGNSRFEIGLLPNTGNYSPKPLNGRSRSSNLGY